MPGPVLRVLGPEEAALWRNRWREVFAAGAPDRLTRRFLWHSLSSGHYPALAKAEARASYESQEAAEYIVLCNEQNRAVVTAVRPVGSGWDDAYVFPPNLAWTMVFTHEDGIDGPFFARHSRHEMLQAENRATLRKRGEAQRVQALYPIDGLDLALGESHDNTRWQATHRPEGGS